MTPPAQDHALEAPRQSVRLFPERSATSAPRLLSRDITTLVDVWMVLSVMWVTRILAGRIDPAAGVFGVAILVLLVAQRGRATSLSPSALDDAGPILRRMCIAYALAAAVTTVTGSGDARLLLAVAVASAPVLIGGRSLSYALRRRMRRDQPSARTLVVGGGEIARRVVSILGTHDEYGLDVVGAADDDPKFAADELGTRILGGIGDIPDILRNQRVDVVIVAFSSGDQTGIMEVIRGAMTVGAKVWVVPRFFELGSTQAGGDHLWGLPVVGLQPPARSRPEWVLKRTLDVVVSGVSLVLLSPLFAVIAALIYFECGRPIFLKQVRVGLDSRPFKMLKFRSMAQADEQTESTEWCPANDRVTRIGKILRDTSLDELPQLINVLRGEMSLVGPRPERPYFVDLFSELYPRYGARHRLPAGLTGWAQIHGLRGDTSIEERAAFDNYYVDNWSLSKDVKILFKTATTFTNRGGEDG
jgi:exopolysaccharide biosynthesis polyprenyl glycosylphosphotransferase